MIGAIAILGGGAVGLTLAARLARAGHEVHVVTRRPEAAAALARGLVAEDAATGETFTVPVGAGTHVPPGLPVLCCTRGDGLDGAIAAVAAADAETPTVTFQNDVVFERRAAARLVNVIGGVWRETCTALGDARVRFQPTRRARAVLGRFPEGRSDVVDDLAALLRSGDIDVGVSERISEDKWLKLCVNLTSAPNALIRRSDHCLDAFAEVKVRLLEEARATLQAAGIVARSCDGRDRSLDEEVAHHRESVARGTSARAIPLYNQVWRSLRDGAPLEADGYHERIISLGAAHGVATPANRHVLRALRRAHRARTGPEQLAAADLLA